MSKKRGVEDTKERISRLENKIKKLEREKKKLISENRTLQNALNKSEEYVEKLVNDNNVDHIVDEVKSMKMDKKCPSCGKKKMCKFDYGEFYIESCNNTGCEYRNRIHEGRSNKTK